MTAISADGLRHVEHAAAAQRGPQYLALILTHSLMSGMPVATGTAADEPCLAISMSLQKKKCVSLEQLIGTWLVRRKIVDYLAHTAHSFEGLAILTHDRFEERGELILNGHTLRSCRTYKLAWSASSVAVLFPNASRDRETSGLILAERPGATAPARSTTTAISAAAAMKWLKWFVRRATSSTVQNLKTLALRLLKLPEPARP